jgi:hypothetical protein
MTALVLNRFGEAAVAKLIIKSLKETASTNEKLVNSTYRNSGFTD